MANKSATPRGIRVGLLTFGDGRAFLQEPLREVNERFLKTLKARLENDGFEVVPGSEIVWQNDIAVREARRLSAENVDVVIFNFSVWAWPMYARMAAQFLPQPILMFSNVNPQYPGLVGMLANAGALDQVGIQFYKTFGDIADDAVLARVRSKILSISAANKLRGQTYGLIGGRSLGIDTAVADPALWMEMFGIDVDHVDQMELVRRAEAEIAAKNSRVPAALDYLKKHARRIQWTGPDEVMHLTEDLFKRQLGMYYAALDLCREFKYDFCGIKGQRELTEHYVTADVAEAFLNDPYGPEGESREPIVCSTEADMDAALTMQIFKLLAKTPVLFADVRHYHADLGVWDLCNSGEHATYFAARSFDPKENLAKTEFRAEGFYFPAGGASVYHIAAPGEVTLARLTRSGGSGSYRMAVVPAELVSFGEKEDEALAAGVQDNWPHAFARFACTPEEFIDQFHCNHIHGVYGDYVEELRTFCDIKGIEFVLID
ncbi:MAG: L-fucose/L-arabinose isomerase family protein [Candidatus Sumerlaeaceae bacterium]